ncbi:CotH kinase family protein [Candidatus Izimaplasma bacterium]|nr:CotH kinase family protein [Candidatus Izimaplasma bacterium]
MKLLIKRVAVITLFVMTLVILDVTAEENLLLNIPTENRILDAIEANKNKEDAIDEILNDAYNRDDDLDYERLFNNEVRHTFIIEFTTEEFDGLINDMKDQFIKYGDYRSNNYRNVSVTYIADDEILTLDNVGIRSKGNIFSRRLPVDEAGNVREIHFMLKFNETFDLYEDNIMYNELKKREFQGIEQILFKWNNTNDPSFTNEIYSYDMFQQVGVIVPEASYAEVQIVIDGKVELVTLYNIFEHYDEEFIRRHFLEDKKNPVGDLYKGSYGGTLMPIESSDLYGVRKWEYNYRPLYSKESNKDIYSYDELIRFSYGINNPVLHERKEFLETHFDIDNFLRAMAMNVLLGNPDDYRGNGNNFYYYFDENYFMTYVPFDYDNSIGSGWRAEPGFSDYTLGNDIYEWGFQEWSNFSIPLWDNIIKYEEYQIVYEDYLMEYINNGLFSEETYLEIYNNAEYLYGDIVTMYYDKTYYITTKIDVVREDVLYYRNKR